MKIGIVCYASVGGSGAVATELAKCLAERGHDVHIISSELPFRLREFHRDLRVHSVQTQGYPLFREPQYLLPLANTLVQVSRDHQLDIIHAHYAIPHATAAYLARQILVSAAVPRAPAVITTLHGTDITLLGGDPSYSDTLAFSIDQSDAVTAVSESLKTDTYRELAITSQIRVIPNFLDCRLYARLPNHELRERICAPGACSAVVVHVSNFRPVKRIDAVLHVFRRIRMNVPAKLLLVGEGPESGKAARLVRELGLSDSVEALGEQQEIVSLLSQADLFLLPSEQESFGLAALEAMACEVPVIASRVGGLPEVIDSGVTGFLHAPDDLDGMAASGVLLLTNPERHARMAEDARRTAVERFDSSLIVPRYEDLYASVADDRTAGTRHA